MDSRHGTSPNRALRSLRDRRAWSQREVVERYNLLAAAEGANAALTENALSRYERGVIQWPDPITRRLLAAVFEEEPDALGFARPASTAPSRIPATDDIDRARWRSVRRTLNDRRREMADVALLLHGADRAHPWLLTRPGWITRSPVPLEDVACRWAAAPPPSVVTGREAASAPVRPLVDPLRREARYSHALRALDPPALFENRVGYRLTALQTEGSITLEFADTTYFAMLDVCEAVAHELAGAVSVVEDDPAPGRMWPRLPFRRLVGDPLDLGRRPVLPSINTLTLRRSRTDATFFLHERDARRVAVAGGTAHVVPAGVFQPSSALPAAHDADFDLWRGIMREFSEEFLGQTEHDGTGQPLDYAGDEPFRTLEAARRAGAVRVHWLGFGVDALTLAGEILTVAVVDADVFDLVFGDLVSQNAEGAVVGAGSPGATGIPFTLDEIGRRRLAPAAEACVQLSWEPRAELLR